MVLPCGGRVVVAHYAGVELLDKLVSGGHVKRMMARLLHSPLLVIVFCAVTSHQFDIRECDAALGMQSGEIPDSAITVTSSHDPARVGAKQARLNVELDGGAWCPERHITKGTREYLEVNLAWPRVISAVSLQGRFGNGQGREFADQFTLEYWRPGLTAWKPYKAWNGSQVLAGNENNYLAVKRHLVPPIFATKVRVLPYSIYARTVCIRAEIHGCNKTDGLVSYSAPQGQSRWPGVELKDQTYDGLHSQGQLYGGTGQLNDGTYGTDNFRQNLGHGRGFEWVGWRNTSTDGSLEMTFEFSEVRNFSEVIIHTNNNRREEIEVFSQAIVTGSIGGRYYNTEPVLHYTLGGGLDGARNVSVKLPPMAVRFLKVELLFACAVDPAASAGAGGGLSGEHIGLIGALATVILVLVLVILYIVHRVRGQRPGTQIVSQLAPAYTQQLPTDGGKTALSEQYAESGYRTPYSAICEKYGEPLSPGHYADYQSQDYAEPLMTPPPPLPPVTNSPLSSSKRPTLALADKPPASPKLSLSPRLKHSPKTVSTFRRQAGSPVLEQHYAATDICKPSDYHPDENFPMDEVEVPQIPRHQLKLCEKLGEGQFGEVQLCRIEVGAGGDLVPDVIGPGCGRLVAVKTLRAGTSPTARADFEREVRTLARLQDANIVRVLGVCTRDEPLAMVVEYMEHGDLNQYLQQHVAETALHGSGKVLSYGSLIYMATQISSGMKYLESLNFVHRDLATRNCLVGRGHLVKISDFGMSRSVYANDYYKIEGRAMLPIRWMAWESIFLGKFTTKSDVWSFAVTLWEVLTYARQQPYEELSDERVIEALARLYHNDAQQVFLPQPHDCPREIYDLMLECWRRDPMDRPNFREIHLFLQRKNLGYRNENGS
ncbi:Discoidin domain-containing receptor tyrosine kinase B [Amphibalanus amphitrite]|uniref:Discoidin domain-containing receptor tyrosine kinase B n=1 Tax=Amphibalanus amphitrite TaxID=1232801 RepID=A0A6A4WPW6_AMPAM|nr:Discoidin domain-containing receptor tyrosine kinase B [Amphibalanus amphitrite]